MEWYHNGKRKRSKGTRQSLRSRASVKNRKVYSVASHFCPLLSKTTLPSQFFASGGQSIGASASVSVLPMNIQGWNDWFKLLALQGTLKSLLHTTSQKHQFFGAQPSLWSNSYIHT